VEAELTARPRCRRVLLAARGHREAVQSIVIVLLGEVAALEDEASNLWAELLDDMFDQLSLLVKLRLVRHDVEKEWFLGGCLTHDLMSLL